MIEHYINKIHCGDALETLREIPSEFVNCCISSPPYWALRDYGVDGQLGLEKTFEEYIDKLCGVYDEVKRVLRKDGTCWVNLGDTYSGGSSKNENFNERWGNSSGQRKQEQQVKTPNPNPKCLMLIPQRFAIEMVNRGWILRNVIVWHKPNPMPSSAKDRFTVDFEYVYFFVKSKKYFFEPIYEDLSETTATDPRIERLDFTHRRPDRDYNGAAQQGSGMLKPNPLGRNKRTVWTIPTQAFPEAHFATFPEDLVRPMIEAGCPREVCKKCGQGRRKVYETSYKHHSSYNGDYKAGFVGRSPSGFKDVSFAQHHFKGYTDCGCNAEWRPGVCLDMFRWFGNGRQGSRAA